MAKERTKKLRRRWLAATIALAMLVLVVDYWAYPYGAPMPGSGGNMGENGLWLKYTWYFDECSTADVDALAQRLSANQIRYAYFHVRSVDPTGSLRYRYPEITALVAQLHRKAPGVKLIAWIYAGNAHGKGHADLSNPIVRRRMAEDARWLTAACGFDGVQWDYEICPSGDRGLLDLLTETRGALPPDKLLSVCTALWMPRGFYGWTDDYFGDVARRCDQMTVMAYDSGTYFPRGYVGYMREQVVHVSTAVDEANPRCRVLIGVPTYVDATLSHNPHAENLSLALRGIREALEDSSTHRHVVAGVAVFADYTTTHSDWREYRRDWLNR